MASPEYANEGIIVEIGQQDRIQLANAALDVVHLFNRTAEVQIGFQRLLRESQIDGLAEADAFNVPYETFRNIGRLLQRRLQDEYDQRSVKLRSDYTFRVVFDPNRDTKGSNERSIRSLGYIGNSLNFQERRGR